MISPDENSTKQPNTIVPVKSACVPGRKRKFHFWRIGAFTFLAMLTVPVALMLALVSHDINTNLIDIKAAAEITSQTHLPNILTSQRSLINTENLRRYIETIYSATDPLIRREALYNALALATESVFERDSRFAEQYTSATALIRTLAAAKERAFTEEEALAHGQLQLASSLSLLTLHSGLKENLSPVPRMQHLTSLRDHKRLESLRNEGLTALAPFFALCEPNAVTSILEADCANFQQSWTRVDNAWLAQAQAEQDARLVWRQLDDLLRELSDITSSTEAELTYNAMEHISHEAEGAQLTFYISCAMIFLILMTATFLLHRNLIFPLLMASRYMRAIHDKNDTVSLPSVRIRELQEMLNMLPVLHSYIDELSARSGFLEQEKDKFMTLSLLDGLTGVANRRSFDIRFGSTDHETSLAILMIDVDFFKLYNDTYGHQAGDNALISIARAIRKGLLRATDGVFRYGGEEFCVLLPGADEESAMMVAARIQAQVHELNIPHTPSTVAPILTVSIGVALRPAASCLCNSDILLHADKALYSAKLSGRNSINLFTE